MHEASQARLLSSGPSERGPPFCGAPMWLFSVRGRLGDVRHAVKEIYPRLCGADVTRRPACKCWFGFRRIIQGFRIQRASLLCAVIFESHNRTCMTDSTCQTPWATSHSSAIVTFCSNFGSHHKQPCRLFFWADLEKFLIFVPVSQVSHVHRKPRFLHDYLSI